jgi:sec-independent protein translocase protein TatC
VRLPTLRRNRKNQFARAADGSMTLMEHLYELRDRLFRACVAIVAGTIVGWFLADWVLHILQSPYCDFNASIASEKNGGTLPADWNCGFVQLGVTDLLVLKLKIAMWCGLIISAPLWMYQLWAFIAPGLHRHERRWTYAFAAAAAPLFALGAVLAYYCVAFGLEFLLNITNADVTTTLEITRYVSFVTGMMLLFGVAFEFPLAILLLNVAGVVTGRRMLKWWRIVVFLFFLFAAVATPTGDPFGMSLLAMALSALYFGAVGLAFLNDKRRARRDRENFGNLSDDEISPLEYDDAPVDELDPVAPAEPVGASEPVAASGAVTASGSVASALPLDRSYDDIT